MQDEIEIVERLRLFCGENGVAMPTPSDPPPGADPERVEIQQLVIAAQNQMGQELVALDTMAELGRIAGLQVEPIEPVLSFLVGPSTVDDSAGPPSEPSTAIALDESRYLRREALAAAIGLLEELRVLYPVGLARDANASGQ